MGKLEDAYEELYREFPEFKDDSNEITELNTKDTTEGFTAYSKRTCETCIKFKLNIHDCCKAHPETGEQTPEGYCPNLSMETGFCAVYKTSAYPKECNDFSCVHRIDD